MDPTKVVHEGDELKQLVQRGAITHPGDPALVAVWVKTGRPVQAASDAPALSDVLLQMREEERW